MSDATASQPPGDEGGSVEKSKVALKKEAKRAEKNAKFAAKSAAMAAIELKDKKGKAGPPKTKFEGLGFTNETPPGEKKDISQPMASGYNPIAVEAAWYDWWDKQGFFQPKMGPDGKPLTPESALPDEQGKPFVIPFPPPNVTGSLHIGHGLTVSIQDCLIRWNRMKGRTVLWVPGYDHAGISTQAVVEGRLWKLEGKTRHDYGREAFIEKVWAWKEEYQERITRQMRCLGGSFDWSRVAFTMNESLSRAVIETFCTFHERGVIRRANRLVNWCVRLNTTLSNLELDKIECTGKKWLNVPGYDKPVMFGVITSFAYPIENSDEKIIVATTRPETMLGDTAVAVHPSDPRYKHLHGKFVKHPFIPDRRIPIVCDDIIVDMEFGTGAVKITPAHDPNDYAVGERHNLKFINILNDDGTLNENAGQRFKGMKRFDARGAVIAALKELGLFIETKDNAMTIPICAKSKDIIEPVMKPQWWVNCKPLADEAMKRTREGELKIYPKSSEAEWYSWLGGIQDWCISRQLWWGHRCPAYLVVVEGQKPDPADGRNWVVGRTIEEATQRAEKLAGGKPFSVQQDDDVLDTWFSSGLWPFSIEGWPEKTADFETFYPATILETGWDILFFWVARMVMMGLELTGKMPFEEVICHAMIRDAHGRKMSKSLGNVIDPIDVIQGSTLEKLHEQLLAGNLPPQEIEMARKGQKADFPKGIPQCGTDALRFALCAYSAGGRDINLEINRVEGYRKFCNKLWNATKFALLKLDDEFVPNPSPKPLGSETLVERWIYHKLDVAATDINKALYERNFMAATNAVYNFWLYELCDVYIEAAKPLTDDPVTRKSAQNTLYNCLDLGLRLLHPFMPFVTEELWQRLPRRPNDSTPSIMVSSYPLHDETFVDEKADADFNLVFQAIKAVRSLAVQYNLQKDVDIYLLTSSDSEATILSVGLETIKGLTKVLRSANVVRRAADVPPGCGSSLLSADSALHIDVAGNANIDIVGEIGKAEDKLAVAIAAADKIRAVQAKPEHEKAPAAIREATVEKLRAAEAEIANLQLTRDLFVKLRAGA